MPMLFCALLDMGYRDCFGWSGTPLKDRLCKPTTKSGVLPTFRLCVNHWGTFEDGLCVMQQHLFL